MILGLTIQVANNTGTSNMEQANLPKQDELNALYGAWNPMSYMQGHLNQDLASQFRDQAFQANAGDLLKTNMANQQSMEMNPLLLERQRNDNISTGVKARTDAALEGDNISAMHSKLATQLTDDNIKQLQNDIQTKLVRGTPQEQQQASQAYGHLMEVMKAKTLSDAQMAQTKYSADSHAGTAKLQIQGQKDIEQMRIDAGKYKKGTAGYSSEWTKIYSQAPDRRIGSVYGILSGGVDPISGDQLTDLQKTTMQAIYDQDRRTLNARPQSTQAGAGGIGVGVGADGGVNLNNRNPVDVGKPAKLSDDDLIKQYLK